MILIQDKLKVPAYTFLRTSTNKGKGVSTPVEISINIR